MTRSATSLGAGIPIIQVDEDGESRRQDNLIAVAAPDGDWSRCRGSGIITLAVFLVYAFVAFREVPRWNTMASMALILGAVYFAFLGRS